KFMWSITHGWRGSRDDLEEDSGRDANGIDSTRCFDGCPEGLESSGSGVGVTAPENASTRGYSGKMWKQRQYSRDIAATASNVTTGSRPKGMGRYKPIKQISNSNWLVKFG